MSRETHVRFCEHLEGRFLRVTRRIAGFQHRDDAERFQRAVQERLDRFELKLHPDKTRLIEFGRFAPDNRRRRGQGKPQTFDFLGFVHCCGRTRKGQFMVLRLTSAQRMRAKLHAVKIELRRRMHRPIPEQGDGDIVESIGEHGSKVQGGDAEHPTRRKRTLRTVFQPHRLLI